MHSREKDDRDRKGDVFLILCGQSEDKSGQHDKETQSRNTLVSRERKT